MPQHMPLPELRSQLYKRISRGLIPTYIVLGIQSLFKYEDHAGQIWSVALLLTLPFLLLTIPYLKLPKIEKEIIPYSQAKGIKRLVTVYLFLLFLTLLPAQALIWTYAQIGYLDFFQTMLWPIGLISFFLLSIIYFLFFYQPRIHQTVPKHNLSQSLSPTIQIQLDPNPNESVLTHTRNLIRKNQIDRVFPYLEQQTQEDRHQNEIALKQSQYTSLQETWRDQRIARPEAQIELNKIAFALIKLAQIIQLES